MSQQTVARNYLIFRLPYVLSREREAIELSDSYINPLKNNRNVSVSEPDMAAVIFRLEKFDRIAWKYSPNNAAIRLATFSSFTDIFIFSHQS